MIPSMNITRFFKISAIPVVFASLCCLSPVILVAFGLASVSFAASLATTLYGTYKWAFRAVGLILLIASVVAYLRRERNICTIDDAIRRRNEVLNTAAIALVIGALGYVVFLYVIVHYAGVFLGIWQ